MKEFFQLGVMPEDRFRSVADMERRERVLRILNGVTGLVFPLLIMAQVFFFLIMALAFG